MTERQLQEHVVHAAMKLGWSCYHPWISILSEPGYPDLTLVKEHADGTARLIYAELKAQRGAVTDAQLRWLRAFAAVPGVEVYVFRPEDWESGEIVAVLAGQVGAGRIVIGATG